MAKKRSKKYDKPLALQPNVEWGDLMKVALEKPDKKQATKAKRASGKKK